MKATVSDFGDIFALCKECESRVKPGTHLREVDEQTCSGCMYNSLSKKCCRCSVDGHHYIAHEGVPQFHGYIGDTTQWNNFIGFVELAMCRECVKDNWEPVYACGNQVAVVQTRKWEFPKLDPSIEAPLVVTRIPLGQIHPRRQQESLPVLLELVSS